jgi:hypothetical protein
VSPHQLQTARSQRTALRVRREDQSCLMVQHYDGLTG